MKKKNYQEANHCKTFSTQITAFNTEYGQTCIKMSPLGQGKSGSFKSGDLLKEVQFIWNFLWQDKENVTS